MSRRTVVPFKAPDRFARIGIDWTRAARTKSERSFRKVILTYETSCGPTCGPNGLVSILLLAVVSRRQGSVAEDVQPAAGYAEALLGLKLHQHQSDALEAVHDFVAHGGTGTSSSLDLSGHRDLCTSGA